VFPFVAPEDCPVEGAVVPLEGLAGLVPAGGGEDVPVELEGGVGEDAGLPGKSEEGEEITPAPQPVRAMAATAHTPIPRRDLRYINAPWLTRLNVQGDTKESPANSANATWTKETTHGVRHPVKKEGNVQQFSSTAQGRESASEARQGGLGRVYRKIPHKFADLTRKRGENQWFSPLFL
jgi:hypothetical protein